MPNSFLCHFSFTSRPWAKCSSGFLPDVCFSPLQVSNCMFLQPNTIICLTWSKALEWPSIIPTDHPPPPVRSISCFFHACYWWHVTSPCRRLSYATVDCSVAQCNIFLQAKGLPWMYWVQGISRYFSIILFTSEINIVYICCIYSSNMYTIFNMFCYIQQFAA